MGFWSRLFGKKHAATEAPTEPLAGAELQEEVPVTDEDIALFSDADPAMRAAIEEARRTYPEFLKVLQEAPDSIDECLMKYGFPAEQVEVEHMFLDELTWDGENLVGVLASDPQYTNKWECGDRVVVDPEQISDWAYLKDGKGHGGFTFKYMWSRFGEQERAMYGEHPPFAWFGLQQPTGPTGLDWAKQ